MKVKVLQDFFDKQHDLMLRKKGDTFETSKERARQLFASKVAEPIEENQKETPKSAAG